MAGTEEQYGEGRPMVDGSNGTMLVELLAPHQARDVEAKAALEG